MSQPKQYWQQQETSNEMMPATEQDYHQLTKKLAIAIEALKQISDVNFGKHSNGKALPDYELRAIARLALNRIIN